ncbi:DUF1552 domain-containing protein [Planctomicrobium sp. SH664]|uniref:DUF1552 domain-containing protein n=1 Tax=Planctomicrobium sp. SH664 TaxID=3448125 RepID=UPI003F5C6E4D
MQYFYREVPKVEAGEYYLTMLDLIVIALRTDMTRGVTYMSGLEGGGLAIPEIGVTQHRHVLSHHNFDPEVLTKTDEFFMKQFSYFLDKLKATADQGEPLLDSTMVRIGSGMSYGHSHSTVNLPIVLAGGRGLGIKHRQHVDYNSAVTKKGDDLTMDEWRALCSRPKDEKAHLSNLLLTMMQKMDVPAEKFMDSLGPISEIV